MKFNVPQFIDIEDKIAFQLTAKQLGWFMLGGALAFFAWSVFDKGSFIFWAIVIAVFCAGFAFYRPAGLSLTSFIKHAFVHLIKPKIYVWKVEYQKKQDAAAPKEKEKEIVRRKRKQWPL